MDKLLTVRAYHPPAFSLELSYDRAYEQANSITDYLPVVIYGQ